MKRYLFIVSRPPYGSSFAAEQLEAALVAAAFDGDVAILLRDDGVWGLQHHQSAEAIQQPTLTKTLSGLPTYEIERLLCVPARWSRAASSQIKPWALAIGYAEQQALISSSDVVIGGQR